MNTKIDVEGLRAKAEGATKGEWDWGTFANDVGVLASDDLPFCRMRVSEDTYDQRLNDAQYIVAAQPQTIITLLDRIAELEVALRPFAEGSIDVSGSAVILGYPEARLALEFALLTLAGAQS